MKSGFSLYFKHFPSFFHAMICIFHLQDASVSLANSCMIAYNPCRMTMEREECGYAGIAGSDPCSESQRP